MGERTTPLNDTLYEYFSRTFVREPNVLKGLREATVAQFHPMYIAPEQGQFLQLLLQVMGARKVLELGVFTGYSTLWMALELPERSKIIACDLPNRPELELAKEYWEKAGVAEKIDLRLQPAIELMADLNADPAHHNSFDFIFIDADNRGYADYLQQSVPLLRPGGIVALDNVFLSGAVADRALAPNRPAAQVEAMQTLNAGLADHPELSFTCVPIGDGLVLGSKKKL